MAFALRKQKTHFEPGFTELEMGLLFFLWLDNTTNPDESQYFILRPGPKIKKLPRKVRLAGNQ